MIDEFRETLSFKLKSIVFIIGTSIRNFFARLFAAPAVLNPSIVSAKPSLEGFVKFSPKMKFLDCTELQVNAKSPRPERP